MAMAQSAALASPLCHTCPVSSPARTAHLSTGTVSFRTFSGLRAGSSAAVRENELLVAASASHASGTMTVQAVATPVRPAVEEATKRSKVEIFKEQSNYLRHPLMEELLTPEPNVNAAAEQLIKFHGSYQQENREERKSGQRAWQFMMRTKQPGGKVANALYKAMDDLSDKYGNGTLRLTTRQTFQMHGILKGDMKKVFSTVIYQMGSTLGACGDLNRNVLAPTPPFQDPQYLLAQEYADKIAMLLAPQAGAYYDVWVDGEKVLTAEPPDVVKARNDNSHGTNFEGSAEPIYGTQYLPRKFKVAITVPGDNSVDLLTNDVGLVVLCTPEGKLEGFNIFVGGGMGRSHRNDETFPLLAQPLGYVPGPDILYAMKAIVATQRDFGRRDDRRQARMKYLINDWGIDKFRAKVEEYYGKKFEPFQELPPWEFKSYLGWGEQGDGKLYYGLHIDNGRIKGDAKKALREVIEQYNLPVRISANQNLMLCDIRPAWKTKIIRALAPVGILGSMYVDPLNVTSMACPALPLCGLAITEAERTMPDVLKLIRRLMEKVGLKKASETIVVRMTGCPNGCARPYMAEIGFVGDGPNCYQLWLGGCPNQTRLASVFLEKVKWQDFDTTLEPLLCFWRVEREANEAFGDFCNRVGFPALHEFMANYRTPRKALVQSSRSNGRPGPRKGRSPRLAVDPELLSHLDSAAGKLGEGAKEA
eukprot:TRINITY_DN1235_c0_g3_i2.p1 TRINITY_DN1235_c0_g3~~TRINITY_DN1235_c0_g3_i2.p1  ORF type:complete len:704 (-),score=155.00 TRINITY_DN1235_c0_g3_i2:114-2225(-)